MKTLRKLALVTTATIVAFVGINTPTDTITAESERLYEATHSPDVHSYAFCSIEELETETEKMLREHKEEIEKEQQEELERQEEENEKLIHVKEEEYRELYTKEPEIVYDEVQATIEDDSTSSTNGTPKKTFVGNYDLTAYVATGSPCADGSYPQVGYTVASNDPALWHKWIEIEGHGIFYVHDTGGMSSSVIDIFVGSYGEAVQFGCRNANVYIVEY